jgi:hypothetical protein
MFGWANAATAKEAITQTIFSKKLLLATCWTI